MIAGAIPLIDVAGHLGGDREASRKAAAQLRWAFENVGFQISDAASPQAAAQGRKPSQNEAYFRRRERAPDDPAVIANKRFHGLNQWPADLPGLRQTTLEYMRTLEALCRRLGPVYATA